MDYTVMALSICPSDFRIFKYKNAKRQHPRLMFGCIAACAKKDQAIIPKFISFIHSPIHAIVSVYLMLRRIYI